MKPLRTTDKSILRDVLSKKSPDFAQAKNVYNYQKCKIHKFYNLVKVLLSHKQQISCNASIQLNGTDHSLPRSGDQIMKMNYFVFGTNDIDAVTQFYDSLFT